LNPVKCSEEDYKLGIWVRDDTQGIGTLTYVREDKTFGALGHGISDADTGGLLQIKDGQLYETEILGIHKGSQGSPGELSGLIRYEDDNILGEILSNTELGIFGKLDKAEELQLKTMEVAYKQELELGEATILCQVDGEVEEYEIEITKIDKSHSDTNKGFVLKVTDERLLEKTGGIVQGMSGSPVIQNGKFVGAVTHVFVQDSTGGYGIFAETMLDGEK
jgi:stage IV sporulation protein B